jgi:hypothetical protein
MFSSKSLPCLALPGLTPPGLAFAGLASPRHEIE